MAVTIGQLAAALRLTDGADPVEPQLSILTRLSGVADAFIDLLSPTAPDAIKDEAKIRMAGYLYDAPTATSGDRYASAWRNSGAAALVSRWVERRAVGADGTADAAAAAVAGLSRAEVIALIEEHRALAAAHHDPGEDGMGGPGMDATARAAAAANATALAAHNANANAHHVPPPGVVGAVSESARLPVGTVSLRLGWAQSQIADDSYFIRANTHPTDGAAIGTVAGLNPPPFPPALNSDPSLYLYIWIGTARANIADIRLGGETVIGSISSGVPYTLEGEDGTLYISEQRLSSGTAAYQISAVVGGDLIASQPYVDAAIAAIPPAAAALSFPEAGFAQNLDIDDPRKMRDTGITIPADVYFMVGVEFPASGASETPSSYSIVRRADLMNIDPLADGVVGVSGDYIRLSDVSDIQKYLGRTPAGTITFSSGTTGDYDVRVVRLA